MGQITLSVILGLLAAGGFWSFLQARFARKDAISDKNNEISKGIENLNNSVESIQDTLLAIQNNNKLITKSILGLGHDRICYLGNIYLKKGNIKESEYDNIHNSLYLPYLELGGNGTAKKIMTEIEKLPIKEG